jgi:hypothetical protein
VLFPEVFGSSDAGEVELGVAGQDQVVEDLKLGCLGGGGLPVEGLLPLGRHFGQERHFGQGEHGVLFCGGFDRTAKGEVCQRALEVGWGDGGEATVVEGPAAIGDVG